MDWLSFLDRAPRLECDSELSGGGGVVVVALWGVDREAASRPRKGAADVRPSIAERSGRTAISNTCAAHICTCPCVRDLLAMAGMEGLFRGCQALICTLLRDAAAACVIMAMR